MKLGNDEYSERVKFAFVVWQGKFLSYLYTPARHYGRKLPGNGADSVTGPQTKVMRKAKMSFQSGQVKQVIRTYAVEIQTSDKKELEADAVTMKLRRAMGANCKSSLLRLEMIWALTLRIQMTDKGRTTRFSNILLQNLKHHPIILSKQRRQTSEGRSILFVKRAT